MNEQEQAWFDQLESFHKTFLEMGMKEAEILRIAKTNGMIPWKAITAYCDKYNSPHPDWPVEIRI